MRVTIFNPSFGENFVRVARWAAKSRGRVQRHPDYLLTAAQVLIDAGHEVTYVEAAARNLPPEESYDEVVLSQPDLVLIHATTPSIYNDIEQAKVVKERTNCKVVFVGQHVTAEPYDTFSLGQGVVDFILRGEYDFSLRELANGVSSEKILGLSWWHGRAITHNPERPCLDVNELPFPAWHLIKPEWYPDAGKKFPFLTLLTGRGCNNACTFCRDPQLMYGYRLRMRDAQKVVDEMEFDLALFPRIQEIMFETDTFAANRSHVEDVCKEIIRRGLNKRISWSCNARIDTPLDLLPLMRQAGCRMLMVGYEFGYDEAFRAVRKGGVNVNMARQFTLEARRLGFIIHGCFMIGAPGETKESARRTINFAKSLPMDTIQITGIATYPGTVMYKWAKENGYLLAKDWRDWLTSEREQKTLLNYPQLSNQDIDALIDQGLREFYLRPAQIGRMILAIHSWSDFRRKIYGFKAFLNYFFRKILTRRQKNR